MMRDQSFLLQTIGILLCVMVVANGAFWAYSNDIQPRWANVPPPPEKNRTVASFLGDEGLAYRVSAFLLQNYGNTSGAGVIALKDYDYGRLAGWFRLLKLIDARSDYVPFMAAYYFSATQDPSQLDSVIDYLADVGRDKSGEKWRWLAQAVYLAKHRQNDLPKALKLAHELSQQYRPGMPAWSKQMEAIISNDIGDKKMAYAIMLGILTSNVDHMHPNEINHTRAYICEQILDKAEAAVHPLCQDPM